jgi:hypothetical protein
MAASKSKSRAANQKGFQMIAPLSFVASDPRGPLPAVGLGTLPPAAGTTDQPRNERRCARLLLATTLAVLASGCASYMSAQVTSFHQAAATDRFAGQGFVIEPTAAQKDSLEFRAYADLVREALVRRGLVDAPESGAALAVAVRFSVDSGKPVLYSYPAYGYAGWGSVYGWAPYYGPRGHVHYALTATYPIGYGMFEPNYYTQSVLYKRELRVDITDRRAGGGTGAKLYEGTVVSEGESAALAPVMPAMVQALFSDFPGPSGVARRVQVRLDAPSAAAN